MADIDNGVLQNRDGGGGGGGMGDITAVMAGTGLSGGGQSGAVELFIAQNAITEALMGPAAIGATELKTQNMPEDTNVLEFSSLNGLLWGVKGTGGGGAGTYAAGPTFPSTPVVGQYFKLTAPAQHQVFVSQFTREAETSQVVTDFGTNNVFVTSSDFVAAATAMEAAPFLALMSGRKILLRPSSGSDVLLDLSASPETSMRNGHPTVHLSMGEFNLIGSVVDGTVYTILTSMLRDEVAGSIFRWDGAQWVRVFEELPAFLISAITESLSSIDDDDELVISDDSETGKPNKTITWADFVTAAVSAIAALTGAARLSYNSLKDLPSIPSDFLVSAITDTLTSLAETDSFVVSDDSVDGDPNRRITFANLVATVVNAIGLLSGANRLSYNWLRDTPTIPAAFDINGLASIMPTTSDEIVVADVSANGNPMRKTTVADILGLVSSTTFLVSAISGTLTSLADEDSFVVSDESETGDPNRKITFGNLVSSIVSGMSALTGAARFSYNSLRDTPVVPRYGASFPTTDLETDDIFVLDVQSATLESYLFRGKIPRIGETSTTVTDFGNADVGIYGGVFTLAVRNLPDDLTPYTSLGNGDRIYLKAPTAANDVIIALTGTPTVSTRNGNTTIEVPAADFNLTGSITDNLQYTIYALNSQTERAGASFKYDGSFWEKFLTILVDTDTRTDIDYGEAYPANPKQGDVFILSKDDVSLEHQIGSVTRIGKSVDMGWNAQHIGVVEGTFNISLSIQDREVWETSKKLILRPASGPDITLTVSGEWLFSQINTFPILELNSGDFSISATPQTDVSYTVYAFQSETFKRGAAFKYNGTFWTREYESDIDQFVDALPTEHVAGQRVILRQDVTSAPHYTARLTRTSETILADFNANSIWFSSTMLQIAATGVADDPYLALEDGDQIFIKDYQGSANSSDYTFTLGRSPTVGSRNSVPVITTTGFIGDHLLFDNITYYVYAIKVESGEQGSVYESDGYAWKRLFVPKREPRRYLQSSFPTDNLLNGDLLELDRDNVSLTVRDRQVVLIGHTWPLVGDAPNGIIIIQPTDILHVTLTGADETLFRSFGAGDSITLVAPEGNVEISFQGAPGTGGIGSTSTIAWVAANWTLVSGTITAGVHYAYYVNETKAYNAGALFRYTVPNGGYPAYWELALDILQGIRDLALAQPPIKSFWSGAVNPTGELDRLEVLTGGSGYTNATVAFTGGGPGAVLPTATVIVAGGAVTGFNITNRGNNISADLVATISGNGTGATARATRTPTGADRVIPLSTQHLNAFDRNNKRWVINQDGQTPNNNPIYVRNTNFNYTKFSLIAEFEHNAIANGNTNGAVGLALGAEDPQTPPTSVLGPVDGMGIWLTRFSDSASTHHNKLLFYLLFNDLLFSGTLGNQVLNPPDSWGTNPRPMQYLRTDSPNTAYTFQNGAIAAPSGDWNVLSNAAVMIPETDSGRFQVEMILAGSQIRLKFNGISYCRIDLDRPIPTNWGPRFYLLGDSNQPGGRRSYLYDYAAGEPDPVSLQSDHQYDPTPAHLYPIMKDIFDGVDIGFIENDSANEITIRLRDQDVGNRLQNVLMTAGAAIRSITGAQMTISVPKETWGTAFPTTGLLNGDTHILRANTSVRHYTYKARKEGLQTGGLDPNTNLLEEGNVRIDADGDCLLGFANEAASGVVTSAVSGDQLILVPTDTNNPTITMTLNRSPVWDTSFGAVSVEDSWYDESDRTIVVGATYDVYLLKASAEHLKWTVFEYDGNYWSIENTRARINELPTGTLSATSQIAANTGTGEDFRATIQDILDLDPDITLTTGGALPPHPRTNDVHLLRETTTLSVALAEITRNGETVLANFGMNEFGILDNHLVIARGDRTDHFLDIGNADRIVIRPATGQATTFLLTNGLNTAVRTTIPVVEIDNADYSVLTGPTTITQGVSYRIYAIDTSREFKAGTLLQFDGNAWFPRFVPNVKTTYGTVFPSGWENGDLLILENDHTYSLYHDLITRTYLATSSNVGDGQWTDNGGTGQLRVAVATEAAAAEFLGLGNGDTLSAIHITNNSQINYALSAAGTYDNGDVVWEAAQYTKGAGTLTVNASYSLYAIQNRVYKEGTVIEASTVWARMLIDGGLNIRDLPTATPARGDKLPFERNGIDSAATIGNLFELMTAGKVIKAAENNNGINELDLDTGETFSKYNMVAFILEASNKLHIALFRPAGAAVDDLIAVPDATGDIQYKDNNSFLITAGTFSVIVVAL